MTSTALTPPLEVSPRDYHTRLTLDRADIFSPQSYLSKSRLWELQNNSLYRWRYAPAEFTGSDAADWGSIIDCLITTPDELEDIIAVNTEFENFRTKAAREWKADAKESGKIVCSTDELEAANRAAHKIIDNPIAGPLLEESKKQVVLLNTIKGIQFKALVDIAPGGSTLVDLKTTNDLTPDRIARTIAKFGYHVQAALYLKLWNLCHPDQPKDRFLFIWQQSGSPYEVAVSELPTGDLHAGEDWILHQINRLTRAAKSKKWPNIFDDKIALIGRPAWAGIQDEETFDGLATAPAA